MICRYTRGQGSAVERTRPRGETAHHSEHRPEVGGGGALADFSTVLGPFFD
jgi:hypothetical protein